MSGVPHLRIVVAASVAAVAGYAAFSVWVVGFSNDVALKGDVIGTWKSFAVLAFGFWLGSSSGGKSSTSNPPIPEELKS
jgi:archaeosine-15-forming tRNA-guanine transglycosylase